MISHFTIKGNNKQPLDILAIYPSHPIGIIQFVHGMCDHKQRYFQMMEHFSKLGYVCIAHDQIGHGKTAQNKKDLGYFGEDGCTSFIEDVRILNTYITNIYPHLPIYLFGHSMGSLIARVYIKKYPETINGLILCGSPSDNHLATFAKKAASLLIKVKGEYHRSQLVYKLSFSNYNKKFKESHHPNRWLAKNPQVALDYSQDPYCNFTFTLNGFYHLFSLMESTYSNKNWNLSHLDLPILFIAGEDDPCIISPKDFQLSIKFLENIGYKNIQHKLYPTLRHEIFNEKEKEIVFKDVEKWLKKGVIV